LGRFEQGANGVALGAKAVRIHRHHIKRKLRVWRNNTQRCALLNPQKAKG